MFFKEELQNVELETGGKAILHCEISRPDAPVEWRKGALVLRPSAKYEMRQTGTSIELIIHGVESEDCGAYACSTGDEVTTGSVYVQGRDAVVLLWARFCSLLTRPTAGQGTQQNHGWPHTLERARTL